MGEIPDLIRQDSKKFSGDPIIKKSKMRKFNEFQKTLAWALSVIVIFQFTGCYTVRKAPRSELGYSEKTYYYLHGQNTAYQITGIKLSDGIISGTLANFPEPPKKGQVLHLYVAPDSAISENGNIISVPSANIAKMEVYKVDAGRSVLLGAAIAYGALIVTAIIVWLTKEMSCPFVYSEAGADIIMEGEIYSGATAIPVERDDYLKLKSISPVDGQYRIRITNEVKEIQNTNLAELLVFDHRPDAEILVDKYGVAHSITDIIQPVRASNAYGKSLLTELSQCDKARYFSEIRNDNLLFDTINLSFERPANSTHAKLVVSAKNTMWLDYMFGRLSDMFGNRYDEWVKIRNKRPREVLLQWSLDQGIPLAVYLETDSGLEFVDYYNTPGPAADKKDVLQIDLSGISGDMVNVKLVSGVMFWDFDFAGMDFTGDLKMAGKVISLETAVDETGKDVSALLLKDDDKYLVQPYINNEARMSFKVPPLNPGMERTVFLHSKGNYEPVRDAKGKPDMEILKGIRQPGMFTRFTKDHFLRHYAGLN